MGTPRGVLAFVERLERRMADLLSEETRVILAYSGGLSSTLVAMVARKRCDLVCVVAGVEGSSDVRAARAAKDHLDYRIQSVPLDRAGTRRIIERLGANNREVAGTTMHALVPLRAVMEELPNHLLLAGFGTQRIDAKLGPFLEGWGT